jgi:glycosyltransferase involved in cell wall biosynthesis
VRVVLDVTPLVSGSTGVARYARRHLEGLRDRSDVEVRAFAVGRGPDLESSIRRVRVPLRVIQRGYRHLRVPRAEWLGGRADLVHAIDIVPPPTRSRLVVTVHDVLPLVLPEQYAPRQRMMIKAQLRAAAKADLVVTTCEATAAELVERTDVRREQVLVAPLGHRPPSAAVPDRTIAEPYILAVGSLIPRKGFHHLVDAVAMLGADAPLLVLVGPDGFQSEVIHDRVSRVRSGRVRMLGYVDDQELEALYRHAEVLCHPSEAEGFGIPVLEGMGYGTPVVACDIPPVREIGGDAVVLVPPRDPGALAEALSALLGDAVRRRQLVERGLERARPRTWRAMTDLIVDGYRRVVA